MRVLYYYDQRDYHATVYDSADAIRMCVIIMYLYILKDIEKILKKKRRRTNRVALLGKRKATVKTKWEKSKANL